MSNKTTSFNKFLDLYLTNIYKKNKLPVFFINDNEISFIAINDKAMLNKFNQDMSKTLINNEEIKFLNIIKDGVITINNKVTLNNTNNFKESMQNELILKLKQHKINNYIINNEKIHGFNINGQSLVEDKIRDFIYFLDNEKMAKKSDLYSIFIKNNNTTTIEILNLYDEIILSENIDTVITNEDIDNIIHKFSDYGYVNNKLDILINNRVINNKEYINLPKENKIIIKDNHDEKFSLIPILNNSNHSDIIYNGSFIKRLDNGGLTIFIQSENDLDMSSLMLLRKICGSYEDIPKKIKESFFTLNYSNKENSPLLELDGIKFKSRILQYQSKKNKLLNQQKTLPTYFNNENNLLNNGLYLIALKRLFHILIEDFSVNQYDTVNVGILTNKEDITGVIYKDEYYKKCELLININHINLESLPYELAKLSSNYGLTHSNSISDITYVLNNELNTIKKDYSNNLIIKLDNITYQYDLKNSNLNNQLIKMEIKNE